MIRLHRYGIRGLLAIVAAISLSFASAQSGAEPVPGGHLTAATSIPITTLTPAVMGVSQTTGLIRHVIEGLTGLNENNEVVPLLAESWETSEDGLTWTFHLRQGVTFHDGTQFNAQAVAFNLERLWAPENNYTRRTHIPMLESWTVVDDYTLQLHLSYPYGALPNQLTSSAYLLLGTSPASVEQWGEDEVGLHLVGTGAFRVTDFVPGEKLELERYGDYWGEPAYLDAITFVTIPEDGARVAALMTGEIQFAYNTPPQFAQRIKANPSLEFRVDPGARVVYVGINWFRPEFQDVLVRRAMNHAVNRDAMLNSFLRDVGSPALSVIPETVFGYAPVYDYEYDPAMAEELLAQAGWTRGPNGMLQNEAGEPFPAITLRTFRGRVVGDFQAAQVVQEDLRQVGFDVELMEYEMNAYWEVLRDPRNLTDEAPTQLNLFSLGSFGLDASYSLDAFDARQNNVNWVPYYYTNEEIYPLLDLATSSSDPAERLEAFRSAQELIAADAPWIPLYSVNYSVGLVSSLNGVVSKANEEYRFDHAWFDGE